MRNTIQYIIDNQEVKTLVIVPFDKWEKINSDYKKLRNKLPLVCNEGLVVNRL
ncbi:MAG: hypothetical protein NTY07_11145 [Bacteroidia bacterium]|nr:hypothetical protein [Bacteroidia bacterium]